MGIILGCAKFQIFLGYWGIPYKPVGPCLILLVADTTLLEISCHGSIILFKQGSNCKESSQNNF